ncbi:MAG: hypothetical protein NVSMB52_13350 [Chloroflexota bacterium]
MGLHWSTWMPLMAAHPLALAQLPSEPGVYRVRRARCHDALEWIGWDGRGVREVVERLSRQVHMPAQPYDDPRGPAGVLWKIRQENGVGFEVSGAQGPIDVSEGKVLQARLRTAYNFQKEVY